MTTQSEQYGNTFFGSTAASTKIYLKSFNSLAFKTAHLIKDDSKSPTIAVKVSTAQVPNITEQIRGKKTYQSKLKMTDPFSALNQLKTDKSQPKKESHF